MKEKLSHEKILELPELKKKVQELKGQKKRIVFTNGCFDILHPGHVDILARAKALGDILILGLNSDDSVRRQNKGVDRPINSFPSRAFVLAHLESIDFLVSFDDDTPLKLIKELMPEILVKGGDWELEKIVGAKEVKAQGGKVYSLLLMEGFSTTALINKIRQNKEE